MNEALGETFDRLSVPSFIRPALTEAIEDHVAARLASVEALADEWEGYGKTDVAYHWLALSRFLRERAGLGSDAHTEQKGTGE